MDDYWDKPECQCKDCGKTFRMGDQGDHDEYCLRCMANWRITINKDDDYEERDW